MKTMLFVVSHYQNVQRFILIQNFIRIFLTWLEKQKKSKITFQWTLSFIQNHFSLNLKDFRSRSRKAGEESWQYWNCISDSCWGHSFYFIIETSEQIMCSCYTAIVVMKDKMLRMLCKTERQNNGKIIGS